ncbi:MAG: LysM peptidoglycan-binding domain-containing protein [Gammaproteobacteria bacterium]|nr:LysM peptidoglycan-binding domain-containing protein [Gammaproteobacteria bacterium]
MSHSAHNVRIIILLFTAAIMAFLSACAKPVAEQGGHTTSVQSSPDAEDQTIEAHSTTVIKSDQQAVKRVPTPVVRPVHPKQYVVKKGDTLWDIARTFLKDPWFWPEIWHINPQIANPHLIYPGDVISLVYINGQPKLVVSRHWQASTAGDVRQVTERLQPRVRAEPLGDPIPSIPLDAVEQFMSHPRVITMDQLEQTPYVIGNFDGRLVSALNDEVYVRGIQSQDDALFTIFRLTKALRGPKSDEVLGYEVAEVADAKMIDFGDPSTLIITKSLREVLNGDRLLPQDRSQTEHNYLPRRPELPFKGSVISLFDAISHVAQNQVVVINIGQRDGIEVSDVLAIERRGRKVQDRYSGKKDDVVHLPNTRAGVIMIFQVYDRVSYGLIMESTRAIQLNDIVTNL